MNLNRAIRILERRKARLTERLKNAASRSQGVNGWDKAEAAAIDRALASMVRERLESKASTGGMPVAPPGGGGLSRPHEHSHVEVAE